MKYMVTCVHSIGSYLYIPKSAVTSESLTTDIDSINFVISFGDKNAMFTNDCM